MKAKKTTWFERAIFLSWYCSKADCKFCYMSTLKNKIKNPKAARRRLESILAEALICKKLGWKIEFLSGGYESYATEELLEIIKNVKIVYGDKLWLNLGVLNQKELNLFKPYLKGVCGAVETVNPKLHKKICPSKPIKPIENMFKICDILKLKKSITIIIGVGESINDFTLLKNFINNNKIDKITFYALNPHPGTMFKKGPDKNYYKKWIQLTRKEFPKLEIVAGSWVNRLDEVHLLLDAGADAITKFPSMKLFNTRFAKQIEQEAEKANRKFVGSLTALPKINWNKEIENLKLKKDLKEKIKAKLENYLASMKKKKQITHILEHQLD